MCFVDCTRRTLFDESGGAAAELVRIDDPARFGGCFDLATSIALGLDRYPSGRCDDGGYLVNPDVQLTSTVEADGSVTATGSDQYGVFPVSGVTWAGRATGVPWWLPLNVNDLTANRVTIGWTTFNSVVTAVETLHQEMRLDPTIDVTLGWEGTRAFSVADGTSGEERGHGEGTDATFRVGDTLRLTTDAGDSSAIAVTPSLSMAEATMTNSTRSKSTGSLDLRALSFTLETPRVRICPPDPFDCTTVLSAIDTSEGPLVRHRVDLGQSSAHTVFDGSFEVGGFNTPVLEAFELVPRPVVEVRSSVVPANAPGRFDLLVDGEGRAVDVADGGSTGRLVLDPGTHAIGEAAGAATTLDWFEVSITCVDAHTGTPHATGDPADAGSGTGIDLALEGGDDVVCTVQNRLPVPAECDAMTFDEVILGTPGDDVLVGTSGADLIVGYGGDDEIAAGPGDDCVAGGDGDDAISLGAGDDVAAGDGGDDILNGAHGDDVLRGGDGDDILNGAHGDDVLDGGRGVDRLNGGGGTDLCTSGSSVTGCEASPVDQDGPGDGRVGRGGPPANRVTHRAGHDS
jgi:Ca2+-binding RTX toxin-like protein